MLALVTDKYIFKPAPRLQLGFPFRTRFLDKSWFLESDCVPYAPQGRNLRTYRVNSKAEHKVVKKLLKLFLNSGNAPQGKNVQAKKYEGIISCILANLFWAYDYDYQILYSRSTSGSNKNWLRVFEFLGDNGIGLIQATKAPPGKHGVQSWATATPELMNMLHNAKTRIVFDSFKPTIVVRDSDKNVLPKPKRKQELIKYNKLEAETRAYNESWLNHSATWEGKTVVPFCTRIFKYNLALGGRYYGAFQGMPQVERAKIKIDSVETVELDYKAMHIAILYSWEGLELIGDPYIVDGYERDTIKAMILILLNSENEANFKRAIGRSANPKLQKDFKKYKAAREAYELARLNDLPRTEPYKEKWIDSFIEGIPVGTDPEKLIEAFSERHSAIKNHLMTKDIGLRLQAVDSSIMALILSDLGSQGIPALPVHDSILIKQTDKVKARESMRKAFEKITDKRCLIDQK